MSSLKDKIESFVFEYEDMIDKIEEIKSRMYSLERQIQDEIHQEYPLFENPDIYRAYAKHGDQIIKYLEDESTRTMKEILKD